MGRRRLTKVEEKLGEDVKGELAAGSDDVETKAEDTEEDGGGQIMSGWVGIEGEPGEEFIHWSFVSLLLKSYCIIL